MKKMHKTFKWFLVMLFFGIYSTINFLLKDQEQLLFGILLMAGGIVGMLITIGDEW